MDHASRPHAVTAGRCDGLATTIDERQMKVARTKFPCWKGNHLFIPLPWAFYGVGQLTITKRLDVCEDAISI